MPDTLHMYLPIERIPSLDFKVIAKATNRHQYHFDEDGIMSLSGNIKNLKTYVSKSGVSIKGSLPKYIRAQNFDSISLFELEDFISNISIITQLPWHEANIRRLDIGYTILTDYPPNMYYSFLGEVPRLIKLVQPDSIIWRNKSETRSLNMYDKIREAKSDRMPIPNHFKGTNSLRFESRYFKDQISKVLNQYVHVGDLCKRDLFEKLPDIWYSEFQLINKVDTFELDYFNMQTPNDFIKAIEVFGVRQLGFEKSMSAINLLKANKAFSGKVAYSRSRKRVREAFKGDSKVYKNSLITELNQKMELLVKTRKP